MADLATIKEGYEKAGQSHLFQYWDDLTNDEQINYLNQLSKIKDPSGFIQEVQDAIKYSDSISGSKNYAPLPSSSYSTVLDENKHDVSKWNEAGLKLIQSGKVGVVLMAGGQGTRLGSSDPKGCYDVGLPSGKSLFQLQAERLIKLQKLAGGDCVIPLYVMTSGPTRAATELYYKENGYFGLASKQVMFFNQGVLPALSLDGKKFLMGGKGELVESPDGNGGLYKAIYDNGLLQDFNQRGIEHIHMYCVDNVLVKVCDPIFIGFASENDYDIATKVVRKRNASESVGLIVIDDELKQPCVVEYSEISKELSEKLDQDGLLYFRAANIVNHYYNVEFLKKMIPQWTSSRDYLPYHIAKKKIGCMNDEGVFVKAGKEVNGIKMEQFIFDVFPSVKLHKFGCLEVDRAEEFSPLKNAPGSANDSPETCRLNCLERGTNWIKKAGGTVKDNGLVEVSPLTSYSGEGLESYNEALITDKII
ncbi:hypothetical protein CANARDRAFT_198135 [[Candida] arabinofermentans NRRL YB-2248]|uniref:UDP-N-acetylglucosamine diphosphorylase n=1 Tax=[Candida] arabinofermentans NRRL YB-2248 TaxID=983967 RepID=A0A1E4T2D1_9ASCO|nr:hypothetical protein CANARDRAFT_198135 [[Candida] arabinofermentans NRRL YB-2248]